jgi:uncharacterized protein
MAPMPEAWTPVLLLVVGSCVFLYGFSKTAMPVAGVLAGPLLAAALGAPAASGFIMPLLLVGDMFALARYRQHANWPLIFKLVPGVLLGFAITAVLFRFLDVHTLGRIIGLLIMISLILEVWRRRYPRAEGDRPPNRLAVGFFGTLAGMTTMAANAGGTAMTLYLINMRVSMLAFMGTFAWFFFFLNALKVPILVGLGFLTTDTLRADLWFVPVVVAGALVGIPVFKRMDEKAFTNIALALSAVAATWLLVHG